MATEHLGVGGGSRTGDSDANSARPWMGAITSEAATCRLCDWWFPLYDDGEPIEEWMWKACSVLHGLLLHPKEHHEATGHKAEERLAMYEQELGGTFGPIKEFALGMHLEPSRG